MADVDGIHAGGTDGLHAEVGVLESTATEWVDADAAGGFEEDVGCGFLPGDILVGHDGIKPSEDPQMFEDVADGVTGTAGGDGHGDLAAVFTGDGHDLLDRSHLGQEMEVKLLLFVGEGDGVDVGTVLLLGEDAEDVPRGHAAERVEAGFREYKLMPGREFLPGPPVKWHGVGKGAVAVKDEAGGDEGGHGDQLWRRARRSWTSRPMSGSKMGSQLPSTKADRL